MIKVAVASGKGGTGKTSLTVNWFSWLRDRSSEMVVLVDLDVEEPNAGLFISGTSFCSRDIISYVPEWHSDLCSFCGTCQTVCNYNAIARLPDSILVFPEWCHSCYACSELCPEQALPMRTMRIGQLDHLNVSERSHFIQGKMDVGKETAVPVINDVLHYVDQHLPKEGIQIVDAPPGTACAMMAAIGDADFVVLVTEPTPFGLHDLKLAVQTVMEIGKPFGVVINRDGMGDDRVEQYCQENQIELLGKIPHRKEIAGLYAKGKLFYSFAPELEEFFLGLTHRMLGGNIYV